MLKKILVFIIFQKKENFSTENLQRFYFVECEIFSFVNYYIKSIAARKFCESYIIIKKRQNLYNFNELENLK